MIPHVKITLKYLNQLQTNVINLEPWEDSINREVGQPMTAGWSSLERHLSVEGGRGMFPEVASALLGRSILRGCTYGREACSLLQGSCSKKRSKLKAVCADQRITSSNLEGAIKGPLSQFMARKNIWGRSSGIAARGLPRRGVCVQLVVESQILQAFDFHVETASV